MSVTTATRTFEAVGPDSTGHVDLYVDGVLLLPALSADELDALNLIVVRTRSAMPIVSVAVVDADGDCVICGRPADAPYRRVRTEVGIARVVEGCVAAAHADVRDPWALASQAERRNGTPVGSVPAAINRSFA